MIRKVGLKMKDIIEEAFSIACPVSFIFDKKNLKLIWSSKNINKKNKVDNNEEIYIQNFVKKQDIEKIINNEQGTIETKNGQIFDFVKTKKGIFLYLKKSEGSLANNYNSLFDFAKDIIQSVDSNGTIIYVNKEWERTLGYTKDEAKKMNFSQIIKKEYLEKCMNHFNEIKKGKSLIGVRTCFVSKNGKEIFVEGNIAPIIINGKFIETIGIYRNIKKTLEEENKIIRSKNFLEIVINNSPVCVLVKETKNLKFIFINSHAQNLIGKKGSELIGKDYDSFIIDKKILKKLREGDLNCIKNKRISSSEEELLIKNEKRSVIIRRVPVFLKKSDTPDYLIIICEDITNIKKYENEKEEYSSLWRDTFNALDEMITIHDSDFKIILANKSFYENLKLKEEEVVGKNCFKLIHNKDSPIEGCPLKESVEKLKKTKREIYEPNIKKYLEVCTSPIFKEGEIKNFVHIIRDITFRKKYEEEILKKNQELEKINSFMINRELKMIELKKEVNSLLKELGREEKYKINEG